MSETERDVEWLLELARCHGQAAGAPDGGRLERLAEAIRRWNEAINLVSRKDIARLVSYHFCDSASVLPVVKWRSGLRVLDVGGSNGLPGLVLASLVPQVQLTICDSRQKRRGFLEEMCGGASAGPRALFDNARFEIARADSREFQERHRAGFDLIVARAVTQMKLVARWCMPLLDRGGRLMAYKGSRCREEVVQAEAEIFGHGGTMVAVVSSPWAGQCNPLRLFAIAAKA